MVWVVEACFEGASEPYRKLLKPGQRYTFGRKAPADLVIEQKTISQDSGHIDVGPWEPPGLKQGSTAPPLTAASLAASSQLACSFSSTFAGGATSPDATSTSSSTALLRRPFVRAKAGKKGFNIVHAKDTATYEANPTTFIGTAVEPNTDFELSDGDVILLTRLAQPIRLVWVPLAICVSQRGADEVLLREQHRDLAFLSIPLVLSRSFVAGCTHLVAPTADATAQALEALVGLAHIVGPDFIAEIVRRGDLDKSNGESFEKRFKLPDEEAVFPASTQSAGTSLDEMRAAFVPNEARKTLLQGIKFLVAITNQQVLKQLGRTEHVFEAIGAEFEKCSSEMLESCNDERAAVRFIQGKKNGTSSSLVILAQASSDGQEAWHQAFCKASRQLGISMPESGIVALNMALLQVKTAGLLETAALAGAQEVDGATSAATAGAFPESSVAHDEKATVKHKRKATPPPPSVSTTQAVTPSRKLKRRAGLETIDPFAEIFGTDDPIPPSTHAETQKSVKKNDATQHTQKAGANTSKRPRSSDIWREVLGTDEPAEHASASGNGESNVEPSTKRFRMELEKEEMLNTQRQERKAREQSQQQETVDQHEDTGDIAMDTAADETIRPKDKSQAKRAGSRSRHETQQSQSAVPETIAERPADTQSGTATDQKFLQSVASLKCGPKKNMDDFDKEFDRLRLAKPSSSRDQVSQSADKITMDDRLLDDEDYRAWKEMGEDDFDVRAGGNFVQVDFVPLLRRDTSPGRRHSPMLGDVSEESSLPAKYAGRPNFKKFKSKDRPKRPPVQLDLQEMTDYGVSAAYGRDKNSRAATQLSRGEASSSRADRNNAQATSQGQSTQTKKKSIFNSIPLRGDDDDDEIDTENEVAPPQSRAARSQRQRTTQRSESARQKTRSPTKSIEISDDDDEEDEIDLRLDVDIGEADDTLFNPRSQSTRGKSVLTSTPAAQGASQAKQGARRSVIPTKRSARSAALANDDDESSDDDQGFSFRGFKRTRG